jgi:hypothetical protein
MFYYVLERYVSNPGIGMPLAVDVAIPGDRHYFLFESKGQWYVIVEADYLTLDGYTIDEIEQSFPVRTQGWCVRLDHQADVQADSLPIDSFTQPEEEG